MTAANLPKGLHHTAFVTDDQEKTRHFYEDIIGLPLIATWCESDELFGKMRTYCHTFYGLGEQGALAFFQFADPEDQKQFGPEIPKSPFKHIALDTEQKTQDEIRERLEKNGYGDNYYVLDHGYCVSLYIEDPNGMLLEFTVDHPDADKINAEQKQKAHKELERWLAGDHTSNNPFRSEADTG